MLTTIRIAIALAMTMCAATASPAGSIQIPQTGQTKCYDAIGTEIDCTGTGQDGEWRAGIAWTSPRTIINSDETITDTLTGLIWSRNAQLAPQVTWQQALDYIKYLNDQRYLGYTDWRLPSVIELRSLTNFQINGDLWLTSLGFLNVKYSPMYWSSTSSPNNTAYAWAVQINGDHRIQGKDWPRAVLPVRGKQIDSASTLHLPKTGQTVCYDSIGTQIYCAGTGQDGEFQPGEAWPEPRFAVNSDETISDKLTGLVWSTKGTPELSKVPNPWDYAMNWQSALNYVKNLNFNNYLGHSDWRLPNINELDSLLNMNVFDTGIWLRSQGFPPMYSPCWSATTYSYPGATFYAYVVSSAGGVGLAHKEQSMLYLMPVRGGNLYIGKLNVNPPKLDIGEVEKGIRSDSPQTITLSNSGIYDVKVSNITISDVTNFTLYNSGIKPCNAIDPILKPGDFCTFGVSFTPSLLGTIHSEITIKSNDPSSPAIVQVSGIGINHPSISINNFAQKSEINSKRDAYFDIFVENTGGEAFTNVDVRDEQCDLFAEVDHVGDNILDPGEQWHFSCVKYKLTYDMTNSATVKATTNTGVSRTGYAVATVKVDHAAQCDSSLYTNICAKKGQLVTASYSFSKTEGKTFDCYEGAKKEILKNGNIVCTETVLVGDESTNCLGRCGAGCNDSSFSFLLNDRYTQECLSHDLCTRATGDISAPWDGGGPCATEFDTAQEGWTCAPTCE